MPENKGNPFSNHLDALFYWTKKKSGQPGKFHLFDHKVLLPIHWLIEGTKKEYQLEISENEIIKYIEQGLIPKFIQSDGNLGFPLYITGRINFIKKMEKKLKLPLKEIQEIIKQEDNWINNILTVGNLEYKDISSFEVFKEFFEDDISHIERILKILKHKKSFNKNLNKEELEKELKEKKTILASLKNIKFEQLPERAKDYIERFAFKILCINDQTRLSQINTYRSKIMKGYSPHVEFRKFSTAPGGHLCGLLEIDWKITLISSDKKDATEIKTPEFTIKNGEIKFPTPPSPSRYSEIFNKYNLREFLELKLKVKVCPVCDKEHKRRGIYCSEACRNRAKSKRWRGKHPQRKKLSNIKYMMEAAKDEAFQKAYNNLAKELEKGKDS